MYEWDYSENEGEKKIPLFLLGPPWNLLKDPWGGHRTPLWEPLPQSIPARIEYTLFSPEGKFV